MIRKYETDDTDAIIDVWYKAVKSSTPFLPEGFLTEEKVNIRSLYLPNTETWVALQDGDLAGFTSLIHHPPDDVEVGAIFVDPALQGQGLGKALMDQVVSRHGAVRLDVFRRNAVGRAFYQRYGFTPQFEHTHDKTGHRLVRMVYGRPV